MRLETPSRILSFKIWLYSLAYFSVSVPAALKKRFLPISSSGMGTLAIVSWTHESAPK